MQLLKRPFTFILNNHAINYPTPVNIHYAWNFGFLSLLCLSIQVVSGIFLAMHYSPSVELAFASIEHIMRDVNFGWLLRYVHSNGASMFFIVVYAHILRGLYYGSYTSPRHFVWAFGVIILLLMIITAFVGYVLPWGQMSLWGATVITNLLTVIPVAGNTIVEWIWGGFSVDNPTLNRFFSFHYLLPFVLVSLSILHIAALHQHGSGNPLGIDSKTDKIPLYPYFFLKDLLSFVLFLLFFSCFIYFSPNFLGHPDNYVEANSMVTPVHIVPEWYFLPFYAILRSIPNKLWGVIMMLSSILILLCLPLIHSTEIRSSRFRPIYKITYWLIVACCLILGWIGEMPVESPYIFIGQIASTYYFLHFVAILPILGKFESFLLSYVK